MTVKTDGHGVHCACVGNLIAKVGELKGHLDSAKRFHSDEMNNRIDLTTKLEASELQVRELAKALERLLNPTLTSEGVRIPSPESLLADRDFAHKALKKVVR